MVAPVDQDVAADGTIFGSGPGATASPAPPPGPAIDHPPTRRALAGHARRPLAFLAVGVVGLALGVGLRLTAGDVGSRIIGAGIGIVLVAPMLALRWFGLRRILRRSPWVARRGHYHVTGSGKYRHGILLVEADEHGPEAVCTVTELRTRLDALASPGGAFDIWVAGDPTGRAAATLKGEDVVPIAQPRWGWWRRHLRRRLEIRGVPERTG